MVQNIQGLFAVGAGWDVNSNNGDTGEFPGVVEGSTSHYHKLCIYTAMAVCNMCKSYWQVPLAKDARPYTAFRTLQGLFQFVVMPLDYRDPWLASKD